MVNTTVKTSSIKVYPNPATNVIHLEGTESKSGSWKLYNAMGISVKKGSISDKEINESELPSGMYILTVTDGQNVTAKNVVKL